MKLRSIVLAATLAAASVGAQAALTTYAPWEAAPPGTGLNGVLFNVQSNGDVSVALGAHAFKNGVFLPNNGIDTFFAQPGTYAGPPAQPDRANWSFDFDWDLGASCGGCRVFLGIDNDPTAGVNYIVGELTGYPVPESWNLMMAQFAPLGFNPFVQSSTGFELFVTDAAGAELVKTQITVNVPEPGTLALIGLGLAGIGGLRRRKA